MEWIVVAAAIVCLLVPFNEGVSQRNDSFLLVTSSTVDFNITDVADSVQVAVNEVLRESLLHNFNYRVFQTQCNGSLSPSDLLNELNIKSVEAIVLGFGCTNSSLLSDSKWNDIQPMLPPIVSYASLKNWDGLRESFSVVRVVPSYSQLAQALAKLVSRFNWKQVLLITEEIAVSLKDFRTEFSSGGIAVDIQSLNGNISSNYKNLVIGDKRVIILDTKLSTAKQIICSAFHSRKHYPGCAWIVIDNFVSSRWWEDQVNVDLTCTNEQLEHVLNFSLTVGIHPPAKENSLRFAAYAHDAVTAVALALNKSVTLGDAFNISSFSDVSFEGQSGLVGFTKFDRANASLYINQMRIINDTLVPNGVGVYSYITNELNVTSSDNEIWPLGVPSDGIPVMVIVTLNNILFYVSAGLTVIGVVWTIICFLFLVIYRKAKIIRLTSPKLHYLMLIGSFIAYSSQVLYTLPITDSIILEVICSVRLALLTVFGYNICLAVATVKLWRIYYIFVNPKPNKKIPKDGHLMIVILAITAVDFTVLLIIVALENIYTSPQLQKSEFYTTQINQTTGEVKEFYLLICNRGNYFRMIQSWTFIHKIIIHSASLYFSFRTRKIKVPVLNEYKSTSASAYSTAVFIVLTAILLFPLANYPNIYVICYTLLLFTLISIFVSFTFIPKMIALCKDPKGDKIFQEEKVVDVLSPAGTENF
ncbi:PREDICTED: uncharacterized protein LOC100640450 [Amphimedon queenslandica]|uniref:G-protein coupled receptors family 3 profile domain-containing protein n=1 Tax=Amphimedon queenslandica TaxID=400682 RepID=A0AAN0J0T5_AMPQE|nr:PREDICTED: uncharacterized protein LOC100640450 [Amphimedon queenslandica]|eukprot:XP_019850654.1 PREDICTED: uncharacterized protein LOC100640450 [Amphimedon queenslandica]